MNRGGLNGEILAGKISPLRSYAPYGLNAYTPRKIWRGRGESLLARELKGMMGVRVYPQLGCAPGTLDVGSASGVL